MGSGFMSAFDDLSHTFLLSMGATAVYVLLLNVLVVHMFMFVYITYYLPL
jgi:hypothetical protein